MKKKINPQDIPYNLPINVDIDDKYYRHPDYNREARDMFYTLLRNGDLANHKYQELLGDRALVAIDNMEIREHRAKELQNKEWDVDYIRENGFKTYFPTDEFLKETVFKNDRNFKGVRDYQILDAFMLTRSTNQLITHKMRLGKTMITTMGMLNHEYINKAVVVVPKSTLFEWKSTINVWTNGHMKAKIVSSHFKPKENLEAINEFEKGNVDVIVVNIDHFVKYANDFAMIENTTDLLVVDEAHFLASRNKNEMQLLSGKKAQILLRYRKQNVKFCWLLTGTPTKAMEYEILALYYFLSPTAKDMNSKIKRHDLDNYKWFFNRFCHLDSIPSPANKYTFSVSNKTAYEKAMKELHLNHRIHRNTNDEFPDGSEKIKEDVVMKMAAPQVKTYKELQGMMKMLFVEIDNPLARDTFLRQIAVDHRLIKRKILAELEWLENNIGVELELELQEKFIYMKHLLIEMLKKDATDDIKTNINLIKEKIEKKYGFDKKGAKAEWLLTYLKDQRDYIKGNELSDSQNIDNANYEIKSKELDENSDEANEIKNNHLDKGRNPIVIFSQFKQFLYLFKDDLDKMKTLGFKIEMMTGDNSKYREDIRLRFQNGEIDILLIQTDTVKVGVSLYRSNTAIFVDRKYSNQDMKQAVERINHPDASAVKMTYFLMTEGTIDELVKESNDIKEENTSYVNDRVMSDLTGADVNVAKKVFEEYLNKIF